MKETRRKKRGNCVGNCHGARWKTVECTCTQSGIAYLERERDNLNDRSLKNFGSNRPTYCSVLCSENLEGNSTGSRSVCVGQNLWRRILRKAMLTASSVFLPFHFFINLATDWAAGRVFAVRGIHSRRQPFAEKKTTQHPTPPFHIIKIPFSLHRVN